jgi:hypothetical protein
MTTFIKGAALLAVLLSSFSLTSIAGPKDDNDRGPDKKVALVKILKQVGANPQKHAAKLQTICSNAAELCTAEKDGIVSNVLSLVDEMDESKLSSLSGKLKSSKASE